jgi:DNA-binding MarR family transcriptional regulator
VSDSLRLNEEQKVFHAQPRFSIMYLLFLKRRVGFVQLGRLLSLTSGNLDHHIRKLEETGLVRSRRVMSWKPLVVVEITAEGVDAFRDYIIKLRQLLEDIPGKLLGEQETREQQERDR